MVIQKITLFICILACSTLTVWADTNGPSMNDKIRVGVFVKPPFANLGIDNTASGLSIDTWQYIAHHNNWKYSTHWFANQPDAMQALRARKIDIILTPVITNKAELSTLGLSRSYLLDSFRLMGPSTSTTFFSHMRIIFNGITYVDMLIAFITLMIIIHMILYFSREKRSGKTYFSSFGMSLVELISWGVTGPVKEFTLNKFTHRLVIVIWCVIFQTMLAGAIAAFSTALIFTHGRKSDYFTSPIHSGARVAYLVGNSEIDEIGSLHLSPIAMTTPNELILLLNKQKVDYIFGESTMLLYFINKYTQKPYKLLNDIMLFHSVRFTLLKDPNLLTPIDKALSSLSQDLNMKSSICNKYLLSNDAKRECLL